MSENFKQKLSRVKAFAFDIDGVLTDGKIYFQSDNTTARMLNARDGYAISKAAKAGFIVSIISFAKDEYLKEKLKSTGANEVYLSTTDKEEQLKEFATVYGIGEDEILYMGDDIPDTGAMKRCGVPTCPYDAAPEVRDLCLYISPLKGGDGCVRDVIEQVMRVQGKW